MDRLKIPKLTGDDKQDIAALRDFLYRLCERESAKDRFNGIGCTRQTIRFASGSGVIQCSGAITTSAVCATVNSPGKSFYVKRARCIENGTVRIQLSESYGGIAEVSVFWSKEARDNV